MKKNLLIIAMAAALTACGNVTLENYNQITVGMEKTKLESILGNADACEEKTLHTNCTWGDESKYIKVTLVADKVTLFSEKGL